MSSSKDKRTKGQILRLLDNALTQEELLSDKIKTLETELADCRKKAENPRIELAEEAISSSKVSFRIDYYRTEKNGPLKGIIEHLPSREPRPFEGEGWEVIQNFIGRFLREESATTGKKKSAAQKEERLPEVAVASAPRSAEKAAPPPPLAQREGPSLLQRLRTQFAAETQGLNQLSMKMGAAGFATAPQQQHQRSARIERLLNKVDAGSKPQQKPMEKPKIATEYELATMETPTRHSRLLERLRQEYRQNQNPG